MVCKTGLCLHKLGVTKLRLRLSALASTFSDGPDARVDPVRDGTDGVDLAAPGARRHTKAKRMWGVQSQVAEQHEPPLSARCKLLSWCKSCSARKHKAVGTRALRSPPGARAHHLLHLPGASCKGQASISDTQHCVVARCLLRGSRVPSYGAASRAWRSQIL